MMEAEEVNIDTVDKIMFLIKQDAEALVPDTDNENDLHVCRKCNQVFQSLESYLEHKFKYENYSISETLSKLDQRIVQPHQQKKSEEVLENARQTIAEALTSLEGSLSPSKSTVKVDFELDVEKHSGQLEGCAQLTHNGDLINEQAPENRDKKRKSLAQKALSACSDLEVMYTCTLCEKKFRREASLRWHMDFGHRDGKKSGKNSGRIVEDSFGNGNISSDNVKTEKDSHDFKDEEDIHTTLEQTHHKSKSKATEELQVKEVSGRPRKKATIKGINEAKDPEKPHVCSTCGRGFKKMAALKTHGAVHSDDRKFVCTIEDCPYGFKLKGGLVRHMRRHTGERPYVCENCGRAFSESGALTRHMKSRLNCARRPGSAYPHYMKNWTYHPNIPSVLDPSQRKLRQRRNKVFSSLVEYSELESKYGSSQNSQTPSHPEDLVTPQPVQKKKRQVKNEIGDHTGERKVETPTKRKGGKSRKSTSLGSDWDMPLDDSGNGESVLELKQSEVSVHDQLPKKRGRKKKSLESNTQVIQSDLEVAYSCMECGKKFRRDATLRWHIKYEHTDSKAKCEYSDEDITTNGNAKNDKDYIVVGTMRNDDNQSEKDEHDTQQEIHVIIEQADTFEAADSLQDVSSQPLQRVITKCEGEGQEENSGRPYICDICGQRFKKMAALKTHGAVHSEDRKFVCTFKDCPYGFKLKGSLVRHMRRHTGERPYVCENCGRAFSESGALTRHMKSRRNCARTPDSAYHRYMRNWTYHPNIPAVMDPFQRRVNQDQCPEWNLSMREVNDDTNVAIEVSDKIVKPFDLALAQETATSQQVLENHTSTADSFSQEHGEFSLSQVSDLTDITSGIEVQYLNLMQCCVCKKDFGTVEGLEIHLHTHLADQSANCSFCHFSSHDQEELRLHILSMHHDSLKDIEASVLSMAQDGEETKSEATQDEKTTTREALVAVKQLYSLKKQQSTDEVDKDKSTNGRLQCMVCNRFFALRSYLQQHMRTHIGDRPYKCHICHRSFTALDVLKKHMYVHKEQRDFKCGECGKLFKRLTYLQQHLKIHTQERTIQCSLCDKLFRTQYSLTVHMRTHSGINPYKCHVCSKHFRERGSLRRHMRLHAGEKPFKCPICNRAFAENGTLSRHLKAKIPCSNKQVKLSVDNLGHNQDGNSNLLTQFSAVVANTQQYIQHVDSGQSFCLPAMHEGQETETLHIFDTDNNESVIIVAEKAIVELIREEQFSIEPQVFTLPRLTTPTKERIDAAAIYKDVN